MQMGTVEFMPLHCYSALTQQDGVSNYRIQNGVIVTPCKHISCLLLDSNAFDFR